MLPRLSSFSLKKKKVARKNVRSKRHACAIVFVLSLPVQRRNFYVTEKFALELFFVCFFKNVNPIQLTLIQVSANFSQCVPTHTQTFKTIESNYRILHQIMCSSLKNIV